MPTVGKPTGPTVKEEEERSFTTSKTGVLKSDNYTS
jgi:hypothetical protein